MLESFWNALVDLLQVCAFIGGLAAYAVLIFFVGWLLFGWPWGGEDEEEDEED